MTCKQYAEKYGVSVSLIQRMCKSGKLSAVRKYGGWCIDPNTPYPRDRRTRFSMRQRQPIK